MREGLFQGLLLQSKGAYLSLLSLQEGRIEKTWFPSQFHPPLHRGSFISYSTSQTPSLKKSIEQVSLELSVLSLPECDIYLLHALIELCLYCIPIGSEGQKIFYYMERIIRGTSILSQQSVAPLYKKQLLCTLLALVGLYPENAAIHALVIQVMHSPIDNLLQGAIHLNSEKLMNQWLSWCLQAHPQRAVFKALPFFVEK